MSCRDKSIKEGMVSMLRFQNITASILGSITQAKPLTGQILVVNNLSDDWNNTCHNTAVSRSICEDIYPAVNYLTAVAQAVQSHQPYLAQMKPVSLGLHPNRSTTYICVLFSAVKSMFFKGILGVAGFAILQADRL